MDPPEEYAIDLSKYGPANALLWSGLRGYLFNTFRGVIVLCEAGLPYQADMVTRCLLEGFIAAEFTLNPKPIAIIRELPELPAPERAALYLLHYAAEGVRRRKDQMELAKSGLAPDGLDLAAKLTEAEEHQNHWAEKVTEPWRQRYFASGKKSYSTLSFSDLVKKLGHRNLYLQLYRGQSWGAHAGNAIEHVRIGEEGAVGALPPMTVVIAPNQSDVQNLLVIAGIIYFSFLYQENEWFGLGRTAALEPIASRFNASATGSGQGRP